MLSCRKHVDESLQTRIVEKFVACEAVFWVVLGGLALFRGSRVVSTEEFGDFDADWHWLEWLVPGVRNGTRGCAPGTRRRRLRLILFGAIDTAWRTGIAVFGLRDAAKWCQCCQVVAMPA